MSLKVCKFGGTSLCSASNIEKVAQIINEDPSRRYVVVSAPGKRFSDDIKITDQLYQCAEDVQKYGNCDKAFAEIAIRFKDIATKLEVNLDIDKVLEETKRKIVETGSPDFAASRGEYLNGKIIAEYLGFEFIDADEIIKFDENGMFVSDYTDDLIKRILPKIKKAVIPGFYGSMPWDVIKTFSRGGSDITGAIVAAALKADLYENWTDVDGFFAADPRIIKNPKSISVLTYRELRELSYMGASVLHTDAIFPVKNAKIPINIKNTFDKDHPGTMIVSDVKDSDVDSLITGIAGRKDFVAIYIEKSNMNSQLGFARKVLSVLERYGVSFEHMPTGIDTLSILVSACELKDGKKEAIMTRIRESIEPDAISIHENVALVATVGHGMAKKKGTAGRLFTSLYNNDINILMIDQGSSELNIIVGVENEDYVDTIKAIYNEFLGNKD